jgi:hypothetical protein
MEHYPSISIRATEEDLVKWASLVTRFRQYDVADFNNLSNVFMSGRKVGKIPTSSTDITDGDRVGDFNYNASYLYLCVDNTGAAWRRISLGVW